MYSSWTSHSCHFLMHILQNHYTYKIYCKGKLLK
jgi:hypothetical protein